MSKNNMKVVAGLVLALLLTACASAPDKEAQFGFSQNPYSTQQGR